MDTFVRLLTSLYRIFHSHETPPSRGLRHEGSMIHSHPAEAPGQSELLPPEVDLSSMANPNAPPEHHVATVHRLKLLLLSDCELLGQGELKIVGSSPIDAGGLADVWVG